MLANGAKLGYSKTKPSGGSVSYTDLPGLKEIPEIGSEKEKVDNTVLTDPHKINELGIGELPEMTYKFKYDNSKADSPYRTLRKLAEDNTLAYFCETDADKTTYEYAALISLKRTGGGVNGVIDFEITMSAQTDITITDPA